VVFFRALFAMRFTLKLFFLVFVLCASRNIRHRDLESSDSDILDDSSLTVNRKWKELKLASRHLIKLNRKWKELATGQERVPNCRCQGEIQLDNVSGNWCYLNAYKSTVAIKCQTLGLVALYRSWIRCCDERGFTLVPCPKHPCVGKPSSASAITSGYESNLSSEDPSSDRHHVDNPVHNMPKMFQSTYNRFRGGPGRISEKRLGWVDGHCTTVEQLTAYTYCYSQYRPTKNVTQEEHRLQCIEEKCDKDDSALGHRAIVRYLKGLRKQQELVLAAKSLHKVESAAEKGISVTQNDEESQSTFEHPGWRHGGVSPNTYSWWFLDHGSGTPVHCNKKCGFFECASDDGANCQWGKYGRHGAYAHMNNVVAKKPHVTSCPHWTPKDGSDACQRLGCYCADLQRKQKGYCSGNRVGLGSDTRHGKGIKTLVDCAGYARSDNRCDGTGYFDAQRLRSSLFQCKCPTSGSCLPSSLTQGGWTIYRTKI